MRWKWRTSGNLEEAGTDAEESTIKDDEGSVVGIVGGEEGGCVGVIKEAE